MKFSGFTKLLHKSDENFVQTLCTGAVRLSCIEYARNFKRKWLRLRRRGANNRNYTCTGVPTRPGAFFHWLGGKRQRSFPSRILPSPLDHRRRNCPTLTLFTCLAQLHLASRIIAYSLTTHYFHENLAERQLLQLDGQHTQF